VSATRSRLPADERRRDVLECAGRVFSKSSYRGATTAEIARESGVTEPVLYRHFASKRELYLACLDEGWRRVRELWENALAEQPEPKEWLGTIGRAYLSYQNREEKVLLVDLWIQALTEASEDPKIRRYVRDQIREVHAYVVDVIRRSQAEGGIDKDRDAEAEAWIFISVGLLATIDRRVGCVVGDCMQGVVASRRRWMLGERA
jgi:AcrR family transcriptional regulator